MFSKEAGIHGGKRARSGRKKVGKALRVVRAFRLSQAVYEKYCPLRGSGHFAGDEDFLAHLLAVAETLAEILTAPSVDCCLTPTSRFLLL